jgi:transcriptional regulator with XRE-family HTH domain
MSEEKTVRELREEYGLSVEELAQRLEVSERTVMLLESSGQTYSSFNVEWGVPVSERYGLEKVFWLEPAEAVRQWEEALRFLDGFIYMASHVLDHEPLITILGDAATRARQELNGCRELLDSFEAQEGQIRFETAQD